MFSSSRKVLNIKGLSVQYPNCNDPVLHDLDLEIREGERLALIGSSGCGKSTVAKVVLQLLPKGSVCQGKIFLQDRDLLRMNNDEIRQVRGERVGLVFQDPMTRLNPLMTAGNHIVDMLLAHNVSKENIFLRERAEELLVRVGISPKRFDSYPHQLSGGMRQRLAIALAISLNPTLIIADEPTTSLDVLIADQIMRELSNLCNDLGSALLLISHDLSLSSKWCNRIAILDQGKIVEHGLSNELLTEPKSDCGRSFVEAVERRKTFDLPKLKDKTILFEVNNLRCWHEIGRLPWNSQWIKAIDNVSFSISNSETLGVVGISGCGKSTLCRALMGLLPIRGGEIKLLGKDLRKLFFHEKKKILKSLQMVFQDPFACLNPQMTVGESISDPLLIHKMMSKSKAREKTRDLLREVGLIPPENFQNRFPHELSGGQQQRVAIARALALNPKVLICDESVSMLDAKIQSDILSLLGELQKDLGLGILFITHDLVIASAFCHRVIVLDKGRIIEEGNPKKMLSKPKSNLVKKLVDISTWNKIS